MIQYSNWTTDEFVRALSSNKPEASPQWGLFLQDLNDRKFTFWRLEWKQKKRILDLFTLQDKKVAVPTTYVTILQVTGKQSALTTVV